MSSPILEFQNVSFSHGPRLLLDRLSFGIETQEMVALIGPNGVGKTTLLRLASRLLQPDAGSICSKARPWETGLGGIFRVALPWSRRNWSCPSTSAWKKSLSKAVYLICRCSASARRWIVTPSSAPWKRLTSWDCVTGFIRSFREVNASG